MRIGTAAVLLTLILGWYVGSPPVIRAQVPNVSLHASSAAGSFESYTGTADVTYTMLPRFDLPIAATPYAGLHHAVVHFAVRDDSHFRVDVQILSPSINSSTYTEVVNGSTAISYDSALGAAFRSTIRQKNHRALLADLLSALESGTLQPGVFDPLPDPGKPVNDYISQLQHPPAAPPAPFRFHVRIVGHDTLLGRPVDVIEVSPVTVKVIANTCRKTKTGEFCRPSRFHGSNSARIWVDHEHPTILQYQGHGTHNVHDAGILDSTLSYRVTSITYGQGVSDADLQFQPPGKVVSNVTPMSFMPMGGDSGPGLGVAPPGPFVYPAPPSTGGLSVSNGIQRLGFGPHYKIGSVTIVFSTGTHGTSYFYKPTHLGPMPYVTGPYLLIQEHLHRGGLPAELQSGPSQPAGTCQTWAGVYSDGQRWLAFARKNASVLISTNALTSTQLLQYVARAMCR